MVLGFQTFICVQNEVLRHNNASLSRAVEDLNAKVQLLVVETSATASAEEAAAAFKSEADKQIALARKQRDEATQRLHAEQQRSLEVATKLELLHEEVSELKTKLIVAESSLASSSAESARLLERLGSLSDSNSTPSSLQAQRSLLLSSLPIDEAALETMKLELDEFRAMVPTYELLERDSLRIPELERQIDLLRVELTTAQSKRLNEDALQIQLEASALVQRQLEERLKILTKENVTLKEDSQSWHRIFDTLSAGRTTEEVLSFVNDLQLENQSLLEKLGSAEAQLKTTSAQYASAQKRIKEAESLCFGLRTDKTSLEGVVAQRDAKLSMVERECAGLRSLLDSYKLEDMIGGYDTQKTAQISQLETTLQERTAYANTLETEITELKNELVQLNKLTKRMADERSHLESRLGRGEIDASRTRALHLSETPLDLMRSKDQATRVNTLETQIGELKELLEGSKSAAPSENPNAMPSVTPNGAAGTSTTRVDTALYMQQQQELKVLRKQYQESTVAIGRMKAATEVAVRRYMSSVWNIFGWKVDFEDKNRVKVRYKYWNDAVRASQAVLLFEYPSTLGQKGVNDQLEPFTLLQTPFSDTIPPTLLEVLKQPNTLPLFIARLTEWLFNMVAIPPK